MKILLEILAEVFSLIAVASGLALAILYALIIDIQGLAITALVSLILYIGCTILLKLKGKEDTK